MLSSARANLNNFLDNWNSQSVTYTRRAIDMEVKAPNGITLALDVKEVDGIELLTDSDISTLEKSIQGLPQAQQQKMRPYLRFIKGNGTRPDLEQVDNYIEEISRREGAVTNWIQFEELMNDLAKERRDNFMRGLARQTNC